ncbi:MAG: ATP-binding protein [Pseudonocardiaceae bacterium]
MPGKIELQLPAHVQYVGLARLVVTAVARQAGMAAERIEDLKIAVSEATTNAIKSHQRHHREQSPVVLQFGPTGNGSFQVTIADAGPGFDPLPTDRERDWTLEGGLGVMIIRELADDVTFIRSEGMRVHMNFRVGLDPPTSDQADG